MTDNMRDTNAVDENCNPSAPSVQMTWSQATITCKSEVPRLKNHTATLVGNKIYIFGGYDGKTNHNQMHVLDCTTYQWKTLRNIGLHRDEQHRDGCRPDGRNGHSCTLAEEQLWILGGWLGRGPLAAKDLWVFDTILHEWILPETHGTPGPCNMHTCDYLPHEKCLLVFRGGDGRSYLNELHRLDLLSLTWSQVIPSGRLPVPRANHSTCLIKDQLFIFGGWDGKKRLNDLHVLNTRNHNFEWTHITPKSDLSYINPFPRAGMTLTDISTTHYSVNFKPGVDTDVEGKYEKSKFEGMILFGGSGAEGKCFEDLYLFTVKDKRWQRVLNVREDTSIQGGGTIVGGESEIKRMHLEAESKANEIQKLYNQGRLLIPTTGGNQNEMGAYGEGNPNAEPPSSDMTVLGKSPGERAGHAAVKVGRRVFVLGGSHSNKMKRYYNDLWILDTDPLPVISVSDSEAKLEANFGSFVNCEDLSDVQFFIDGRTIFAHKVILSCASERFRAMFVNGFKESTEREIKIDDVSYDAFMAMLEYIYTGRVSDLVDLSNLELGIPVEQNSTTNSKSDELPTANLESESDYDESSDEEENLALIRQRRDRMQTSFTEQSKARKILLEGEIALLNSQNETKLLSIENLPESAVERIRLVCELLSVSDRYVLDHLKQVCEFSLQQVINAETVYILLKESQASNAEQLEKRCHHFIRNYNLEHGRKLE